MTEPKVTRRTDRKRVTYAVSVDPDLVVQIDALVKQGVFRSRSHGFEEALRLLVLSRQAELLRMVGSHAA